MRAELTDSGEGVSLTLAAEISPATLARLFPRSVAEGGGVDSSPELPAEARRHLLEAALRVLVEGRQTLLTSLVRSACDVLESEGRPLCATTPAQEAA